MNCMIPQPSNPQSSYLALSSFLEGPSLFHLFLLQLVCIQSFQLVLCVHIAMPFIFFPFLFSMGKLDSSTLFCWRFPWQLTMSHKQRGVPSSTVISYALGHSALPSHSLNLCCCLDYWSEPQQAYCSYLLPHQMWGVIQPKWHLAEALAISLRAQIHGLQEHIHIPCHSPKYFWVG